MKSSEYLLRIASAELGKKLASKVPAPDMIPARDHVLANLDAIKRARDAGWSIKQIHAEFEACGMAIEFNTFRKYVSDYAPARKVGPEAPLGVGGAALIRKLPEPEAPDQATSAPKIQSRFRSAGM